MCICPVRIRHPYADALSSHRTARDAVFVPEYLNVPCGKCSECQKDRIRSWQFRNYIQYQNKRDKYKEIHFVTLTISPTYYDRATPPSFYWRHFTDRVRKAKEKIEFFCVHEYGEDPRYTHRLHFHLILYCNFSSWKLQRLWTYGRICSLEFRGITSVMYISKYLTKSKGLDWPYPQRVRTSVRFGYSAEIKDLYASFSPYDRMPLYVIGSIPYRVPRYYLPTYSPTTSYLRSIKFSPELLLSQIHYRKMTFDTLEELRRYQRTQIERDPVFVQISSFEKKRERELREASALTTKGIVERDFGINLK